MLHFILDRLEKPLKQCLDHHGTLKLSSENQTTQHFKSSFISSVIWVALMYIKTLKTEHTSPVSLESLLDLMMYFQYQSSVKTQEVMGLTCSEV